jgi:hypothetical protein
MATTNIQSFSGKIEVNGTTPSSSKTTGALTVAGGVGVTSNIHASNLFASDYVAIGTTSPGQKLEVGHYGGALSSDLGAIRITNHATNLHATSLARFDISLGDIGSNTGSGKRKLIFNSKTTTTDSGTDILCLDGQTNNVGIGTDSPATKCQIAGKTTISENISTQNETRVYNADLSVVSEIPYLNSGTADIDIGAASTEIGDYTSTYRYKLYTDVGSGNSSFKIASVSSLSDRYSGYGTVTDRITLLPSGNVGIGTASPLAQLDVMTAAGGTGLYVRGDEYGTNNQATHIRIGAGGGAANAHHAMITGGHTTSGSSYLSFSTIEDVNTDGYDPAERMRIDRFGNVGIGVTNPTRSLQIERGISYISGGTSNNSAFEIVQQLGTDDYTFKGQHRAQFRIKSGLGTYSNRSLELALLDNGRGIMQASAASEGYFPISINPKGDYNSTVSIGSYYSSAKLRVEGNVYATSDITTAGNVGIGSYSPGTKLDVAGVGRFTINGGSLQLVGTDHTYLEYYPDGTSAGRKAYVGYASADDNNFTISNSAGSGHIILGGGKCIATSGFLTTEFTQSLAKATWTNIIDFRSTLFAYGQTFISGTDYGIGTGGHGRFLVYTDTGSYTCSYTEFENNGVAFRVSGNHIQAYWTSYLSGTRTIYFRYTVLNNRR